MTHTAPVTSALPATGYSEVSAEQNPFLGGFTSSEYGRERKASRESATVALTFGFHEPVPVVNAASEPTSMFGEFRFEVPPGVCTVTPTTPEPGGATVVITLSLSTEKDGAPAEPKVTAVAP